MSVIQSLQNLFGNARISPTSGGISQIRAQLAVEQTASADYRNARSHLLRLHNALETLADLVDVDTRFKLDLPDALSTTGIGLDLTHTAASLASFEEINNAAHSFSPFGPVWQSGSSALMTISGEYDGSDGSGDFGLEVRRAGTHGVNDLRVRFESPGGSVIQNINIRDNDDPDLPYSLGNGLFLTLGPGSLINRDFATLQLFENVGASVNPDMPLGGVRDNNPNLQYGLPAIADGSFTLNGENISVSTADSMSDVINRINLSDAGVTATFNAVSEQVEFLQDTLGATPTIDLQSDTSNFVGAMKLDSATVVPGIDPETVKALQDVAAFSTVTSGNILINGTQIAVDTANDSLTAVIDRINASPADVVASFNEQTQRFQIEARDTATRLEIDGNGTGFFGALNMVEGRVDPESVSRGISKRRSYDIADAVSAVFEELNFLFRDQSFDGRDANAGRFRGPLGSALRRTFGSEQTADLFGLLYDKSTDAKRRGDYVDIDRAALTKGLQLRGDQVQKVFVGSGDDSGLVYDLLRATRASLSGVNEALGITGTFVDTFA